MKTKWGQTRNWYCNQRMKPLWWNIGKHQLIELNTRNRCFYPCLPQALLSTAKMHNIDVIMGTIASQIISLTIVYSTVNSDADQRKHQSSASLAFARGNVTAQIKANTIRPDINTQFPFANYRFVNNNVFIMHVISAQMYFLLLHIACCTWHIIWMP